MAEELRTNLPSHNELSIQDGLALAASRIAMLLDQQEVVLVALIGGSASGKTSYVAPALKAYCPDSYLLMEDNYCLGNSYSTQLHGVPNLHVFADYDPHLIEADLRSLKAGQGLIAPTYSYIERERSADVIVVPPERIIIMEGMYLLQEPVVDLFDIKIFIDTDDHSRFVRRMLRDRRNPNQSDTHRLREYCELSYPGYYREVVPYANKADITVINPYSVREGIMRLMQRQQTSHQVEVVNGQNYYHSGMAKTESIYVAKTDDGSQVVTYVPDISQPKLRLDLKVLDEGYAVDLTKVGYRIISV